MIKRNVCFYVLSLLVLYLLAACSSNGSTTSKLNCSREGEICVTLSTVKSFASSDPIGLKITITSSKDISDLNLTLHTGGEITMDGPQTWENNLSSPSISPGYAYWNFSIKGGQTLTYNRVLHLLPNEGNFNVNVDIVNLSRTIEAQDSFYIHLTKAGGQVILAGTPLPPYTPNLTLPAYGPGTPVPTFITNPTNPGNITTTPVVPLVSTSTPTTQPYPPPSSPTPSPTSHPYP